MFSIEIIRLPIAVDSICSAHFRFLTQYHSNSLKLRTVQRFSRAIWAIMFVCVSVGFLRFFEHGADVYQFCLGMLILAFFSYFFLFLKAAKKKRKILTNKRVYFFPFIFCLKILLIFVKKTDQIYARTN